MNEGSDQRDRLLDALISTYDLRRRFHHQADFRHAVELLVRALPRHVEFLAQSADEAERERSRAESYLMKAMKEDSDGS